MKKLFIIVNEDRFFLSHRVPIAIEAKKRGYEITIVSKDTGRINEIKALGLRHICLPIDPTGMNPKGEIKTFIFLYQLYRKERPDIVHHVGLKSILWGGLAAKILNINGVVNAVCGLGGIFNGDSPSLLARCVLKIMRYANHRNNIKVIFQNHEDERILKSMNVVNDSQIEFTHGSGIDLTDFSYEPERNDEHIYIIFAARMVKEKGVCDLIEAAEILKSKYGEKISFLLCGRLTPNKSGVTEEYMQNHCDGKYIKWLGERNDIKELLKVSHIVAFPSYYREGLPKSLIEASAIGRPIITCNSPGCNDVVDDGLNGFLIPPRNPKILAERLETLIKDSNLRKKMGTEARKKADKIFSIRDVIDIHISIYDYLLGPLIEKQKNNNRGMWCV